MNDPARPRSLTLTLGHQELVIRRRYEALSILNDILVGVWFLIGSVLFFSESTTTLGTWLFVVGSAELLIRPVIRLTREVHIGRLRVPAGTPPQAPREAGQDF